MLLAGSCCRYAGRGRQCFDDVRNAIVRGVGRWPWAGAGCSGFCRCLCCCLVSLPIQAIRVQSLCLRVSTELCVSGYTCKHIPHSRAIARRQGASASLRHFPFQKFLHPGQEQHVSGAAAWHRRRCSRAGVAGGRGGTGRRGLAEYKGGRCCSRRRRWRRG